MTLTDKRRLMFHIFVFCSVECNVGDVLWIYRLSYFKFLILIITDICPFKQKVHIYYPVMNTLSCTYTLSTFMHVQLL